MKHVASAKPTRATDSASEKTLPGWMLVEPVSRRRGINIVRITSPFRFFARLGFVLCVLLPALLGGYYYTAAASDQFETESRLVVRTIGMQTSEDESGPGRVTMLGGAAVIQDAHILVNYLKSLDIVQDLQEDVDLRALFSRAEADPVARLDPEASLEKLHAYWLGQTIAYVDGPSGIIQFTVRAFTPEDAVQISQMAIDRASRLIEVLSEQAKQDLLERAKLELDNALAVYLTSLNNLRDLQNEAGILNPLTEAGVSTELIASLFLERLQAEAEMKTLEARGVTNSPQLDRLRTRIEALDAQIARQRQQMAGMEQQSGELSAFFAQVTALETERLLAESLYRSASRNFDLARSSTQRQSTFVSVFAPPIMPSVPSYPQRFMFWLILVSCCLAAWGTAVLIWAAVEDHRN